METWNSVQQKMFLSYQITKPTIENIRKYPRELGVGKYLLNIVLNPKQNKTKEYNDIFHILLIIN